MDQSFYIPRTNYAPGNPWGSAAASYGSDLDRLQAQQQQGYQIQAQGPLSIYDRFMQGYQQAKAQQQAEAQAQQEADFKQQQIAIQKQRWDQQDQQAKLRDTAVLQGAVARSYRPELRQAFKAQLQAINPEWDDNKLEAALPAKTPETIKIGDNAPVPLSPYDPTTLQNPNMQDTFRGMDVLKEEDAVRKSDAANALMEKIAAMKDSTAKSLADQKSELMMKLQELKGQQGLQSLKVQIDAGRFNKGPGSPYDANDPNLQLAAQAHAAAWVKGKEPPNGLLRDKVVGPMIQAELGKMIASGDVQGQDLATASALFKANSASLTGLTKNLDAVEAFSNTAKKSYGAFVSAIDALGNTASPWMNKPINQVASGASGDPRVTTAAGYGRTAMTEFARVITQPNLAGQLTDNARQEMFSILGGSRPEDATLAQAKALGAVLNNEASWRKESLVSQRLEAQRRISGGEATSPSPNAPQGDRVTVRSKTGQVGTIPRTQLGQAKLEGYTEVQ